MPCTICRLIVESADEVEDKFRDARRAESRREMREYQSDYDYYYY
jgi:hypothetical protein